jgi:shikimate dehydrogenase
LAKSFYGLIGYPIQQSFSPGYFNEKFRREGIDAAYQSFPLKDIAELPALLQSQPGLRGLNVTIPYKTAVIPFLDELSADAQDMNAVNCITILRNDKLKGYNTDWSSFLISLQPLLKGEYQKALVLGSGGAAKAVTYALRQLGIKYNVVSRGTDYSPFLSYSAVTPDFIKEHQLLINTTPLGMHPDTDRAPELPYDALTSEHLLYDLIYNPEETLFLKKGRERGAATKNGLEMLHLQAEASWKIWSEL